MRARPNHRRASLGTVIGYTVQDTLPIRVSFRAAPTTLWGVRSGKTRPPASGGHK